MAISEEIEIVEPVSELTVTTTTDALTVIDSQSATVISEPSETFIFIQSHETIPISDRAPDATTLEQAETEPIIIEVLKGLKGDQGNVGPQGIPGEGKVDSVNGDQGPNVIITKATVGLGNVDNTSDANKPISIAAAAALALKADDSAVVKLAGTQTITGIKTFPGIVLNNRTALDNSIGFSSGSLYIEGTSGGSIYLRPNGAGNNTGLVSVTPNGIVSAGTGASTFAGSLSATGNISENGQRVYSPNNIPSIAVFTSGTIGDSQLPGRLQSSALSTTDWNTAVLNGFYKAEANALNTPTAVQYFGLVENWSTGYTRQTLTSIGATSADSVTYRRHLVNSVWSAWYKLSISQAEQDSRYAQIANTVLLTGNQTIAGVKTFTEGVVTPGLRIGTSASVAVDGQLRLGSSSPSIYLDRNGTQEWLLYDSGGQFYIRDLVNARMQMSAAAGTTDAIASTTFGSRVYANGGFYGSGANITSINATNLTAGTIPDARLMPRLSTSAPNITDFNDAVESGWYKSFDPSSINQPTTGLGGDWLIEVIAYGSTNVVQTANRLQSSGATTTMIYRRHLNGGVWGSWYKVVDSQPENDARYSQIVNTVLLTGNQTIAGIKTFSSSPVVPDSSWTIAKTTGLQAAIDLKANLASPTFTGTVSGITAAMVGLGNVNNTSDAAKPISTATQTALDLKAPIASPTFTGTVSGITKAMVGLSNVDNTGDASKAFAASQITSGVLATARLGAGTASASTYLRGDGTWVTFPTIYPTLASLTDTTITTPVAGHFLRHNGTVWVNAVPTKTDVGLANVDNTSDANKPVSTATQTALNLKANISSLHAVATSGSYSDLINKPSIPVTYNDLTGVLPTSALPPLAINEVTPVADQAAMLALPAQRGDMAIRLDGAGTFVLASDDPTILADWKNIATPAAVTSVAGKVGAVTLVKADVGLGSVDNTSDAAKPVSTATQTALNLKANLASPTFTGTVSGITKAMVGLGSVDNTADTAKPVSTAQQTALNLKANLAGGAAFTGVITVGGSAVVTTNDARLSDARTPIAHDHKQFVVTDARYVPLNTTNLPGYDVSPDEIVDNTVTAYFSQAYPGGAGSWRSALTVKGWADGYAAWQIMGPSSNAAADDNFYMRSGLGATWRTPVLLWHDGNFNPASKSDTTHGHALTDANITGILPIAQVPTGTTSTTVALGNHLHTGVYEPVIAVGTTAQYYRGDKTWQTLTVQSVSGAAPLANPTFTGTVSGITAAMVGAATSAHGHVLTGAEITGTLPIAKGGTNSTATATAGGIGYGTGTAHAYTAAGTAKQVIQSNAAGAPTWVTLDLTYLPDSWLKKAVRLASVANHVIATGGLQTVDGIVTVAGDRVLLKNQTAPAENGIYQVNAGAWTRVAGGDNASEIAGATVSVDQGTQGGQIWTNTFKSTDVLGTTAMNWYKIADSSQLNVSGGYQGFIVAGTTAQYYRGDKTWQTLDKTAVGLGSVDNTSDAAKPVSTATQTALNLKANLASPTFTGTVSGITATMVGLGSVANTAQVDLVNAQTIGGTKTFTSEIVGPATGNVLKVGDDARLADINVAHVLGIVSQTDVNQGGVQFGSTVGNFRISGAGTAGTATGSLTVTGAFSAASLAGSGASITALNATNLSTGTVAQARMVPNLQRVYYTGAAPARPTGSTYVEWVGPNAPTGMVAGDTWVATV